MSKSLVVSAIAAVVIVIVLVIVIATKTQQNNSVPVEESTTTEQFSDVDQSKPQTVIVDQEVAQPVDVEPQILLPEIGMTFSEVTQVMGTVANQSSDYSGGGKLWLYNGAPTSRYDTQILFVDKKVSKVCCTIKGKAGGEYWLPLANAVPPSILNAKPTEYGYSRGMDNELIVLWRIGGNTYILKVTDYNRQLYDHKGMTDENGNVSSQSYVNENGKNYSACNNLLTYIYQKGTPKLNFANDPERTLGGPLTGGVDFYPLKQ